MLRHSHEPVWLPARVSYSASGNLWWPGFSLEAGVPPVFHLPGAISVCSSEREWVNWRVCKALLRVSMGSVLLWRLFSETFFVSLEEVKLWELRVLELKEIQCSVSF